MNTEKKLSGSTRLTPCPPELERLISIFNMIPGYFAVQKYSELLNEAYVQARDPDYPDEPMPIYDHLISYTIEEMIKKQLRRFPIQVQEYIFGDGPKYMTDLEYQACNYKTEVVQDGPNEVILYAPTLAEIYEYEHGVYMAQDVDSRIGLLRDLSRSLRPFARFNTEKATEARMRTRNTVPPKTNFQVLFSLTIEVGTDDEGIWRPFGNELFDLITTKKIESYRIRECSNCKEIFWAGRNDMVACSSVCAAAHRQSVWRSVKSDDYQKQKDAYNERRRANYTHNKKLREKKTKPGGS
ncbi:MAG: hypothetical protein WBD16_04320 [Pyrinomonadaceae bacterium]